MQRSHTAVSLLLVRVGSALRDAARRVDARGRPLSRSAVRIAIPADLLARICAVGRLPGGLRQHELLAVQVVGAGPRRAREQDVAKLHLERREVEVRRVDHGRRWRRS